MKKISRIWGKRGDSRPKNLFSTSLSHFKAVVKVNDLFGEGKREEREREREREREYF